MASTYPSVVATLTNPTPTQSLNNPSHSSIHGAANDEIVQLETFIGTQSSAVGTLIYDIRAAASNGGGHVQTADKGGTGQTSYTKGDLLVATSSSVIAKLAVSSTSGQVLTIDTTQSTGMKWANSAAATKISVSPSITSKTGGLASVQTVYYAASITGSAIGTANAVRFTGNINTFSKDNNSLWNASVLLGNNYLGNLSFTNPNNNTSVTGASGVIDGMIIGNGTSSQLSSFKMTIIQPMSAGANLDGRLIGGFSFISNTSSVDSNAEQDLVIKGSFSTGGANNNFTPDISVVEQIK